MSQLLVVVAVLITQGTRAAPLRKSDLVRLLSSAEIPPDELAQLIRRNCLTFQPTTRDRNDLQLMGADTATLAAVDECARHKTPPPRRRTLTRRVAPPVAPPVAPRAAAPADVQVQPVSVRVSPERSGFVSGGGQRGTAGAQLPRPIVFEARDSTGAPLSGQAVTFTGINARTEPGVASTDAAGQTRVGVVLGERAGSATVIASMGVVEKQVAFSVAPGSAAQLVVMCRTSTVSGHLAIRPDSEVALRVTAQDAFANATALLGLRAAVADARIFRVQHVAQDSASGTVVLKPDQAGTTSLAVIANGMRQYLTVTVPPRAAPGKVDCQ